MTQMESEQFRVSPRSLPQQEQEAPQYILPEELFWTKEFEGHHLEFLVESSPKVQCVLVDIFLFSPTSWLSWFFLLQFPGEVLQEVDKSEDKKPSQVF